MSVPRGNGFPKVFFACRETSWSASEVSPLIQEAVALVYPRAASSQVTTDSGTSFYLKEGNQLIWVEISVTPFPKDRLPEYLAMAKQVQAKFPLEIVGILAAPDFETGVRELLELIRIPLHLWRYQRSETPTAAFWIEELTSPPNRGSREPEAVPEEPISEGSTPYGRLSREELREFIQFELDASKR